MLGRKNILRVGLTLTLSVVLVAGPIRSFAATTTTSYQHPAADVFITELQTATSNSAGEEFIELYNNTDNDVDLADTAHAGKDAWKLQYYSNSKLASLLGTTNWSSPTRTISLTGTVPAHDYYVLAAGTYQPGNLVPDQAYSSTLADDGGALQLIDSSTTGTATVVAIHNQFAWSNDKTLPANPVLFAAPGAGISLQRLPNADSEYVNEDGTLTGFTAGQLISPANTWTAPMPASTDPNGDGTDAQNTGDQPTTPPITGDAGLDAPVITELLPNPAAPQTDENDEYIELYNPNDAPYNLNGYTLQTGETTLHNFTFTADVLLAPHNYQAFYSIDTGLSLSNSGGQARLLDKNQQVLDRSTSYSTASDGQAWALSTEGDWLWTITPTPGAENVIHAPEEVVKTSVIKTASKTSKKSSAEVKGITTTKKKAATKTKKPKTAKTSAAKLTANTTAPAPAPIHTSVLVAVATLAVGYMMYEYRKDVANYYHKFRANRAARRAARG